MRTQKRVAAIHDISGFGKCSLTIIMPIIAAAGIEVCPIPTAVLSTHTGGLGENTFRDLTDDIIPFAEHWKSLNISFDAIYSGYVGSLKQLEILNKVIDMLGTKDTLKIVDPVMADNGVLYRKFTRDFPSKMLQLIKKADIVIPNLTEAALLLDRPYNPGPYTEEYIQDLLKSLSRLGPSKVVLTGVHYDDETLGAATYDKSTGRYSYAKSPRAEGHYHGTGDLFASALVAALLNGYELTRSVQLAVDYTFTSIARTKDAGTNARYGVNFEAGIGDFITALKR